MINSIDWHSMQKEFSWSHLQIIDHFCISRRFLIVSNIVMLTLSSKSGLPDNFKVFKVEIWSIAIVIDCLASSVMSLFLTSRTFNCLNHLNTPHSSLISSLVNLLSIVDPLWLKFSSVIRPIVDTMSLDCSISSLISLIHFNIKTRALISVGAHLNTVLLVLRKQSIILKNIMLSSLKQFSLHLNSSRLGVKSIPLVKLLVALSEILLLVMSSIFKWTSKCKCWPKHSASSSFKPLYEIFTTLDCIILFLSMHELGL